MKVEAGEVLGAGRNHIIKRPRLTKLLDDTQARIILLVAPAGYGKTTLAREWSSQRGRHALWYRASASASDIAAIAQAFAKLIDADDRNNTGKNNFMPAAQPPR